MDICARLKALNLARVKAVDREALKVQAALHKKGFDCGIMVRGGTGGSIMGIHP